MDFLKVQDKTISQQYIMRGQRVYVVLEKTLTFIKTVKYFAGCRSINMKKGPSFVKKTNTTGRL
jgi:hypothetical protein